MSDDAPSTDAAPEAPAAPDTGAPDWKAEAEKWQALARKHEQRSKDNAAAVKELDELRKQSMSDAERAVAEAKAAARAEALAEVGSKLVAAEVRAAAAGRLENVALDALLSALDTRRFITDEGEPDRQAIEAFIEGIAPKPTEDPGPFARLDLGQGARGGDNPSAALNGDPLLNSVKAKLGIR